MLEAIREDVVWWLGIQKVEVSVVRIRWGLRGDVGCWFSGWDWGVWIGDEYVAAVVVVG